MSPSHIDFMSFAHFPSSPFLSYPPPSHVSLFAFCGCQTDTDQNQLGEGNGFIWLTDYSPPAREPRQETKGRNQSREQRGTLNIHQENAPRDLSLGQSDGDIVSIDVPSLKQDDSSLCPVDRQLTQYTINPSHSFYTFMPYIFEIHIHPCVYMYICTHTTHTDIYSYPTWEKTQDICLPECDITWHNDLQFCPFSYKWHNFIL